MKKKLLLGLTVLGAASMLCGFDSAETADSLYQKMLDATTDASGASMSMGMNLDAAINVSDGTTDSSLGITMSGTFDVNATMDPVATELVGSMDLSALGQGQHMEMKSYSVTAEDGGLETYSFTKESTDDEGSWAYNKDSNIDMTSLMDLSKSLTAADMADWGLTFELAPEAAEVDGATKFQCFWKIKWPQIMPTTLYILVITTINSFQCFALIQLLTSGGPNHSTDTIMYYIYYNAFKLYRYGYGNAMGVILAIAIAILSALQFKMAKTD